MRWYWLIVATLMAGCGSTPKDDGSGVGAAGGEAISEAGGAAPPTQTAAEETGSNFAKDGAKVSAKQATGMMDVAFKANDFEGLQKAAQTALAQNPNDTKALTALGVVNYQKKKYKAALYFFNKAAAQGNAPSDVYTNMGLVHLAIKDRKKAIEAFKKAYDLNPNDGVAAANLGSIYAVEGDNTKALPVLERAIKAGLRDARLFNNFGVALVANGKAEEAKSVYEEALKINSSYREALFNYAILLIDHLNQPQAGLDTLNRLRFMGLGEGMRERMNSLEMKAKAGVK